MEFCVERNYAGLFLTPGLGKTSITLGTFKALRRVGFVDKMLVIAPLRPCYTVWPKEVKKWVDFENLSVGILHGPKKDKVLQEDHHIYVINPEGLNWLFSTLRGRCPWEMLVVDESSKFKHTNTQRFKTLKTYLGKFKRRYTLTGSPAANSLEDLFGQMYLLDLGKTFSPYITHFRNEFFDKGGYGGYDLRLKPGADKQIYDRIAPHVLRMGDEHLKLPELVFTDIYVDLPPKARKIYEQLENTLRVDFEAGHVVAANVAVAMMKCAQMANGGLYIDGDERTWENLHDAKAEAVADLVEELEGEGALISYEFQHDLDRLKRHLGKDTPHIGGGGTKAKDTPALIARWQQGELPAIIGQPQSMAHGVDGLQGFGRAVIWHSLIWNYEDYDQYIRRIWRQGRGGRVFVYRVIARDTVDEVKIATLDRKEKGQNALFAALKDYWAG